jgi:hypothetical protein
MASAPEASASVDVWAERAALTCAAFPWWEDAAE